MLSPSPSSEAEDGISGIAKTTQVTCVFSEEVEAGRLLKAATELL